MDMINHNEQLNSLDNVIETYKTYIDERLYNVNLSFLMIKADLLKYKRLNIFSDEQINYILQTLEEYANSKSLEKPNGRQIG